MVPARAWRLLYEVGGRVCTMRAKVLILPVAALVLAVAAPAGAYYHWHGGPGWYYGGPGWYYGGPGWSLGFGIGPLWWGPWWGAPVAYQPAPGTAVRSDLTAVDTKVTPEHARVVLNGEVIGVADDFDGSPGYLYLKPGHYTIEFSLKGYRTEEMEIDAQPGRFYPIELKLARIPGETPAPWYNRPEGLPVGRVFGPMETAPPAASNPGPDTGMRPEFGERPREAPPAVRTVTGAALDLRVTPANAAIYIDGKLVGTGEELGRLERGISVAPGKHRVEVMAPGMSSRSIDVDVPEGQRQQVVVALEAGAGQT
jgi:hypothetical protein